MSAAALVDRLRPAPTAAEHIAHFEAKDAVWQRCDRDIKALMAAFEAENPAPHVVGHGAKFVLQAEIDAWFANICTEAFGAADGIAAQNRAKRDALKIELQSRWKDYEARYVAAGLDIAEEVEHVAYMERRAAFEHLLAHRPSDLGERDARDAYLLDLVRDGLQLEHYQMLLLLGASLDEARAHDEAADHQPEGGEV